MNIVYHLKESRGYYESHDSFRDASRSDQNGTSGEGTGEGGGGGQQVQHTFAEAWSTDATSHWHACQDSGCTEKSGLATHTASEWMVDTQADYGVAGSKHKECTVCVMESMNIEKIVELDSAFHDVLYTASRNERLSSIINNLREQLTGIRGRSMSAPGRMIETMDEHRALVEAIAARDVERAQRAARVHLENAEHTLMRSLERRNKR